MGVRVSVESAHYRPEVLLAPHPELDPHPDHVASTRAVLEACAQSTWQPDTLLLYANHLHDNDRWPMGPAGYGIALPPVFTPLPGDRLWSPLLSAEQQLDKAMALGLQHDLQGALPLAAIGALADAIAARLLSTSECAA